MNGVNKRQLTASALPCTPRATGPMDSPEGRRITASLVRRAGAEAGASAVASATLDVWREIGGVLSPVIGSRGVAALYSRSMFLAGRLHPWLGTAPDAPALELELESLRHRIAARTTPNAFVGSAEFLLTFHDLLNSMVGPTLAERMLGRIWDGPAGGESARDNLP